MNGAPQSDVIVVGAGVAGLSAAAALAESGAKVTLLERRPYIGGRAYSYDHPAIEETIDSQHVVLGCCTNILDLCRRAPEICAKTRQPYAHLCGSTRFRNL